MTLRECIRQSLAHPGFLPQWDRLRGTSFSKPGSIEQLIDKATGKYEKDAKELFDFIRDRVLPFALAVLLVELGLDPWRHL